MSNAYFLTKDEKPQSYTKEKMHRSITYDNYVLRTASRGAWYGFEIGAGSLLSYFSYQWAVESFYWLPVMFVGVGITAAGFVGLMLLLMGWSVFKHMASEYENFEYQTEQQDKTEQETMIWNGKDREKVRPSKTITYQEAKFTFTGQNLEKLLHWYNNGLTTIRRETTGQYKGFNDLPQPISKTHYPRARYILIGCGLVDDKNNWTEYGIEWLKDGH